MLVNVVPPTNDFHALARYLVEGDSKPPNPKRVAWTLAHNLPTNDPELAAKLMTATAQLSKRCKNAAYHAMIAWAPDEKPTPEMMQAIALKTLELAGLAEHQALIMGHGDKPHDHLHMLINRVHPVTGRAWDTKHDFALFDRIMRQLSEEHGFRYIPAHRFNAEQTADTPKKPNKRATWAAKRGAKTERTQWSKTASRQYGAKVSERLDRAASWDDLDMAFAEDGYTLQRKGKGLVVGNSTSYAKFSALGLTTSAKSLEQRFGTPHTAWRPFDYVSSRSVFAVDAVDIVRFMAMYGLASKDDVSRTIDDATHQRQLRAAEAARTAPLGKSFLRSVASSSLKPPQAERRLPTPARPPNRATTRLRPGRQPRSFSG